MTVWDLVTERERLMREANEIADVLEKVEGLPR